MMPADSINPEYLSRLRQRDPEALTQAARDHARTLFRAARRLKTNGRGTRSRPDHQQHACLGIIEVNSACNMKCPLCFSDAGPGFNLTLEEVEEMLDDYVRTEGHPEVVQFSSRS